jgi:UDP-N-acetylmuramate dehydrogenase
MLITELKKSLKKLNTFGLDVSAEKYCAYDNEEELISLVKSGGLTGKQVLVLGGGSNLLFTKDYTGIVVHSRIDGIRIAEDTDSDAVVCAGAGVEWDALVEWCVENKLGGIENLSLIPGSVGASPVQNIGAYGVELQDVFEKLEGIWLDSGESFTFTRKDCDFGYRYSIFKGPLKDKAIITQVYLRLNRNPVFKLDYGAVRATVEQLGDVSLENIRKAIVEIRSSKLPDPDILGNAGSFFKNPVITADHFAALQSSFPEVPFYLTDDVDRIKVPAGWLIEKAGWKGKSIGNAGVHHEQALVLVNKGGATGAEILELATAIEKDIKRLFRIGLEREVNVI